MRRLWTGSGFLLLKEDRAFFLHPGVNPAALARAFWHSLVLKDFRSGASTITMQLARLLYKLDTGTMEGKAVQIARALALELAYPKARLLEAYCSLVPCGGNVRGFPAASLLYLGKPLEALSLSETMLLCSLPQQGARRAVPLVAPAPSRGPGPGRPVRPAAPGGPGPQSAGRGPARA